MRIRWKLAALAVLSIAALSGCARQDTATTTTSADSLLSSNPVEQPQGDLTPQTDYQEPAPQEPPQQAPAQAPPRKSSTPPASRPSSSPAPAKTGPTIAAGTPIEVAMNTQLSTESVKAGDSWTGEVKENVIVDNIVVIPAGSTVHGVVSAAQPAEKGSRASLDLAVSSVMVNGKSIDLDAGTESIVAGSTRARNLGAVAGGAAAGALIGKAVGGSGKGALVGGLIGGAAAGAGVAASKGFQVVLKEGTVITFSVNKNTTVRV